MNFRLLNKYNFELYGSMHTQDIQIQSTCESGDYLKYMCCIIQVFFNTKYC